MLNNMYPTVCILAAGRGSRLGQISEYLNKALLPLQDKAAISHIIDAFPKGTPFVIAVGYLGAQIKSYLKIAHPETQMSFVDVDPWEGENSGPGYSLYSCKDLLKDPFYFTCSDTLWHPSEKLPTNRSWIGVSSYPDSKTERFCNIRSNNNGLIIDVKDKIFVDNKTYQPFIGLGFIQESSLFFKALNETKTIQGEIQISSGFTELVKQEKLYVHTIASWYDIGTEELYKKHINKLGGFDFSKENEAFYKINGKIIKFFSDENKASRLIDKIQSNESSYPLNVGYKDNFLFYPFVEGVTLYELLEKVNLLKFFEICEQNFWQPITIDNNDFQKNFNIFYNETLKHRLVHYREKYKLGEKLDASHLEKINWNNILKYSTACKFHGDLQFDNVIFNQNNNYTFIDPRDLFGLTTQYGDQLYDLAKLYAGFLIDFSAIKKNGSEQLKKIKYFASFRSDLKKYCAEKHIPFVIIVFLAGIIFLRMAPLHQVPFCHKLYKRGLSITRRLTKAINSL